MHLNITPFTPPPWLTNPHVQTIVPQLLRRRRRTDLRPERVELPDGDFIDLAWGPVERGPAVLVLHGLEGSLNSHYAGPAISALEQGGCTPVFMHLRGCSAEPNRLARSYHSGATEDLQWILEHLRRSGRSVVGAAGFSLGGNLLLKYLGETGDASLIDCAVAVSVPFRLDRAGKKLEQGFSRVYQHYLLAKLKRAYLRKQDRSPSGLEVDLDTVTTLRQYDEKITAPLNGFSGADDYYSRCSSYDFMKQISRPTLVLQAKDDPFMEAADIPGPDLLGPGVTMLALEHGGHVGFVNGGFPFRITSLIDQVLREFFHQHLVAPLNAGNH